MPDVEAVPLWRRVLRPAARVVRAFQRENRWIRHFFVAAPRRAILSRRLDWINSRHFRDVIVQRETGVDAYLAPFAAKAVPRTIWIFWAQGYETAPPVVVSCIDRIRALHPGRDVRILDLAAAEAMVDMRDVAAVKDVSRAFFADILRLRLLVAQGGVWIDATVWLHRPLDDWLGLLGQQGLFMFRRPRPERPCDNGFIAAIPDHPVIDAWERSLTHFALTRGSSRWPYFQAVYCLHHVLLGDPALLDIVETNGSLPAPPAFLLLSALEGRSSEAVVVELLRTGLPLSKLAYRSPAGEGDLVGRIERLEAQARA